MRIVDTHADTRGLRRDPPPGGAGGRRRTGRPWRGILRPAFLLAAALGLTGCLSGRLADPSLLLDRFSRWKTVGGIRVHYRDTGPGDRMREETPLLMIHGWMGSSYSYRPLLARLSGRRSSVHGRGGTSDILSSGRRRAIALDLPGFGLSRKAGIEYNLEFFMSFLNRYLQVMRLQRVVLVGHSFGGELAVHFALRHPEKVEKLILIAPYGLEGEEGGLRLLRRSGFLVDLFSSLNSRAALEWGMRQNTFHDPALITPDQVDSVAATALTPEGRKAQAAIAKNVLGRYPVDDLLARLKAPVLLIWGEEDRLLELEWGKKYFSLLPPQSAAGLYTVPAAGHLPQVEAPDRTAELILRFLAEARAGAPPGRP